MTKMSHIAFNTCPSNKTKFYQELYPSSEWIPISWDEKCFRNVYDIAAKSRDSRTKIAAIIVKDKRIVAEGYNGFPVGVDDFIEERYKKPLKYSFFEHGERNAIYDCAKRGVSSSGATLFSQGVPCVDCCRGIIQAGITEVVVHKQWQDYEKEFNHEKWIESAKISEEMFYEAGVKVRVFNQKIGRKGFLDGRIIEV